MLPDFVPIQKQRTFFLGILPVELKPWKLGEFYMLPKQEGAKYNFSIRVKDSVGCLTNVPYQNYKLKQIRGSNCMY